MRVDAITYWTGKHFHPGRRIAVVMEDRVVDADLTSYQSALQAAYLINTPGFLGLITVAPAWPNEWGFTAVPERDVNLYGNGQRYKTRDEAVNALKSEIAAYRAEQQRCVDEPAYALEKFLKTYDWTSHMSDDFRAWSAGERQARELEAFRQKVDAGTFETLIERYRPKTAS